MLKQFIALLAVLVLCFTAAVAEEETPQVNWEDPDIQKLYKIVGCDGEVKSLSDTGIQIYFPGFPFDLCWNEASSSEKEKGEYGCFYNMEGNLYVYVNKIPAETTIDDAFIADLDINGATDVQRIILNGTDAVIYNQPSDSKEIKIVSFIIGNDLFSIRFELSENSYVDMEKCADIITLMICSIKAA